MRHDEPMVPEPDPTDLGRRPVIAVNTKATLGLGATDAWVTWTDTGAWSAHERLQWLLPLLERWSNIRPQRRAAACATRTSTAAVLARMHQTMWACGRVLPQSSPGAA